MSQAHVNKINSKENLNIPFDVLKDGVSLFPTKKAALLEGKKYGWTSAIQLQNRFETVWAVGKMDLQPDETAGVVRDVFRLPLLRWDNMDGVQFCPVLKVLRVRR